MTSARPGSGPSAAGLPTTSAVVFDLGGVLIDWDPHYVLDDEAIVALDIAGAQRALDCGTPVAEVHARWRGAYPSHAALRYRLLVDRFGLTRSQTALVDDRRDNVAGARTTGIVAIHYRSAPALRRELHALGVL